MSDLQRLQDLLHHLDGKPYPAYRDIKGRWSLGDMAVQVDYVQGDPFAAPSRMRLYVPTGIPGTITSSRVRRRAAEDWLLRRFSDDLSGRSRGSGRSGELACYQPGPEVVERSAVCLHLDGSAEIRFLAGLPAGGRRILGRQAFWLLSEDVVAAGRRLCGMGDHPGLGAHVESAVRQDELRSQLRERGLVAFVADGSILPRASGIEETPLPGAVPFRAPEGLRITLETSSGPVSGMGIGTGVTLITGGGFHGKSTLLHALQRGHMDHVPGDGRERVVADPDTLKVRAEDGRRIEAVDISAFLRDLPGGRSTAPFYTDDASGSTSQAAAIIEAVESGARVLLMDEDTSATNLLVRDERMSRLIPREREPITPLVERVRAIWQTWGVSVVMVVGGVGDYLAVADRVIGMQDWLPHDLTERARQIAGPMPQPSSELRRPLRRSPTGRSLNPTGKGRVRARDERRMEYGSVEVDLSAVEQVLDGAHAATLGQAIRVLSEGFADGRRTMPDVLNELDAVLAAEGLDTLSPFAEPSGDLVWPRRHEVAAAMNRLRTLEVRTLPRE